MSWKGEETREGLSNLPDAPELDNVVWFALLKSPAILSSGFFPAERYPKYTQDRKVYDKDTTLCFSGLLTECLCMLLSLALRWRELKYNH